eukprot:s1779_g12.t1
MAEDEKTPSAASAGAATPDASTLGSEKLVAAPELTSAAEWPWMKIPEAAPSAEASAKSEVLEDQPLTFQRNLWDRFDFLWKNRIEPSQGLLQKVCDVLKSRAELERKYGESLLSIGESIGPEAGNSLHGAVEAMIVNFRNRGEQSLVLADELESDIIVSFECVIKQHKEVSKRIHSDVQLLVKHLQDRRKVHDKCARRYGSRCVEAENAAQDCLQAVSMKTQERLKLAQQATMLSKQARVAEYDYYSSIDQSPGLPPGGSRAMARTAEEQSQQANVLLYVFVGIYFCMLIAVAKIAHRKKVKAIESHGEVKAHFSGSYGAISLFLTTFSTIYSGYTVIGIPEEAFARGFVALRWIGATLVIVAGMLLFNPRLRRVAAVRGYTSPQDFLNDRYGTLRLRLLCAVCGVIQMMSYITAQIVSFAAMLQGMTLGAIPKWACMVIFSVMILTLEVLGGMNSVVLTDVVQSILMIASFLTIPVVVAAEYGWLPFIGPSDCRFLRNVSPNVTDIFSVPDECIGAAHGCVAAGCIEAVKPEFYQFPTRSTCCEIVFFLLNMMTAAVSPQIVQRTYIATSDADLRIVMGAMLLAPFIAQTPGIIIGLTKIAYDPMWPVVDQEATAFSGLSAQLKMVGPFQYFLVTMMTCSTLAAIMSTADSALMGASSIVSIDVVKGSLLPNLSTKNVVRLGEVTSAIICIMASIMGMYCSSEQLGTMIIFQGGMNAQLLPAFGLGFLGIKQCVKVHGPERFRLYFPIKEVAVTAGIIAGLISFVVVVIVGNPVEDYVPTVYISAAMNFLSFAVVQGICSARPTAEAVAEEALSIGRVREAMSTSREPKLVLVALMLGIAVASAPWYGTPGDEEQIIYGLPRWGLFQLAAFVMMFFVGGVACATWRPPMDSKANKAQCLYEQQMAHVLEVLQEMEEKLFASLLGKAAPMRKSRA